MSNYKDMTTEELREMIRALPFGQPIPRPALYELHRRLWNWLVNNADDFPGKSMWPGWDKSRIGCFGGRHICNSCFMCEAFPSDDCGDCPLAVPGEGCHEYKRWQDALEVRYLPAYIDAAVKIRDCIQED